MPPRRYQGRYHGRQRYGRLWCLRRVSGERFLRDAAVAPNIEGSGDIQYLIHGMFVAANGNTN